VVQNGHGCSSKLSRVFCRCAMMHDQPFVLKTVALRVRDKSHDEDLPAIH
jgi:hypothetical protein